MNCPLLSVVVPVYKAEPYLHRCLESLLSQSYTNMEVICVNDGSPDRSAEILAEFALKDERVKIINQSNQGQAAARMAGLNVCSGEWVAMVDSDDYLEPDIYRKVVSAISDDIDLLCFNTSVVEMEGGGDRKGMASYLHLRKNGKFPVTPRLIGSINVMLWNKLWRRSLIQRYGIAMPKKHIHEDYVFFFNYMSIARKVRCLSDVGYNYIVRPGSLTSTYEPGSPQDLVSYSHSWDYILEFHAQHHLLESRADIILEGLEPYLFKCSLCSRLEERIMTRESFLFLVNKYRLMDYPQYASAFCGYQLDISSITGDSLTQFVKRKEREVKRMKLMYKLSLGRKRRIAKKQYRRLLCFQQWLRDKLMNSGEGLAISIPYRRQTRSIKMGMKPINK